MLMFNDFFNTNVYLFTYMFIYNFSLTLFFWTLFSTIVVEKKSLYSFSNFSYSPFFVVLLTVLLCSMAGVPPFIGFFSKLFIIVLLVNNSFFLLYSLFFVVLFLGLYFYIQNMRFLHSTNMGTLNTPYVNNERVIYSYYTLSTFSLLVLSMGLFYIDDILLMFAWLFS